MTGCSSSPRRMIVDVSVIYQRDAGTGIQRVVRNVWRQLLEKRQRAEVVPVFIEKGRFYAADIDFLSVPPAERRSTPLYIPCPGDAFLGLDFSPQLLPRARRAVARWKRLGIPIYLIVYDLLPITNPQWFTRRGARNYRRWFSFLEDYCDTALCISSDVARELRAVLERRRPLRFWRRSPSLDVQVIRLGTDFEISVDAATAPQGLPIAPGRPLILMVGTVEPRKGYDFALRVFDHLWSIESIDPLVVLVGKPGWKTADLQGRLQGHSLIGHSLFWFQSLKDNELAWLYANSSLFFSASEAEGFGLPLVEARAFGLPVVATDLPVFRELGYGIEYFEIGSVSEAADKIIKALRVPYPIQKGDKITWSDTAKDISSYILG